MPQPPLTAKLGAECLGTFGLVLGGCGSAVLAATFLSEDSVQLGSADSPTQHGSAGEEKA